MKLSMRSAKNRAKYLQNNFPIDMKQKNQPGNKVPSRPQPPLKPAGKEEGSWTIILTLILVLIAYLPVFTAGFVNWDDDDYVVKNTAITSFSNIGTLLTGS